MAASVLAIFVDLYPRVMVSSTSPAYDLTVHNTASGSYSLRVMTVVAVVALPFVLGYQAWSYYVFRRRISSADFAGTPGLARRTGGGPEAALAAAARGRRDVGRRPGARRRRRPPPRGAMNARHGELNQTAASTGPASRPAASARSRARRPPTRQARGRRGTGGTCRTGKENQVTDQHVSAARLTERQFRALYDRLRAVPGMGSARPARGAELPDTRTWSRRPAGTCGWAGRSRWPAEWRTCRAGQPRAGRPRAGDGRARRRRHHRRRRRRVRRRCVRELPCGRCPSGRADLRHRPVRDERARRRRQPPGRAVPRDLRRAPVQRRRRPGRHGRGRRPAGVRGGGRGRDRRPRRAAGHPPAARPALAGARRARHGRRPGQRGGAQRVRVGRGDLLFVRVGHRRRQHELGAWDVPARRAGLHPTALEFVAERQVAVLGSDSNSDTAPSVADGVRASRCTCWPSTRSACTCWTTCSSRTWSRCARPSDRWSFLCVIAPLRLTGGTGSPVNPIAIA